MVDSRYPFGTLSISLKSDYLVFTRGTAFCASMNILRFKHARAIFFGNCGSLGNRRNTPVSVLQNAVFDAPEILFRVSRRWKIDVRSHISVRAIKDLASNNSILKLLRCLQSSLGPDPWKVDTSGVSYAAWGSVADVSASKSSGARRLHQECRLRVL